jgi:hypothetical protein
MEKQMEPLALSVAQFVTLSGISRSKTYELIRSGELATRKCGSRTLILRGDADGFLNGLPFGSQQLRDIP